MKPLILLPFLFLSIALRAQVIAYQDWIKTIPALPVHDSILLDIPEEPPVFDDSLPVKAYLYPLYGMHEQGAGFAMTGKISNNPAYDILFLYKYKQYSDSLWFRDIFLCTMDKSGKLLHFELVARRSMQKRFGPGKASTWFFKDGSLVVSKTSFLKQDASPFLSRYKINDYGVIVYYPAWTVR